MIANKKILEKAKNIKLIATDVDGVWTDSKMYYSSQAITGITVCLYEQYSTLYRT